MKRDLAALAEREFDVVIIGGGVYGLSAAWDAALRGLRAALLEKDDFAHACTAGSFKLVHGGLRYLQHLDFHRMRVSIRERRNLLEMAPHLVQPLRFVLPCYGHGMKGPEVMRAALAATDLVGWDRNRGQPDPHQFIPRGRTLGADETRAALPGLTRSGLTGGAEFYDAQMYSGERLALAFARAAAREGAVLANYAPVIGFRRAGNRLRAARARDALSGREFEVRGRVFLNMTGPWTEITRALLRGAPHDGRVLRSKGVQLLTRKLADVGFAVETRQKDLSALISRGGRNLFAQPWRGLTFIGQTDKLFHDDPDRFGITEEDIAGFLEQFNEACPDAGLRRADVRFWVGGLIPVGNDDPNPEVSKVAHKFEILDHRRNDGIENAVSVQGVKYTICRYLAERAVDLAARKLGRRSVCLTAHRRLPGGDLDDVAGYVKDALRTPLNGNAAMTENLMRQHGTDWTCFVRYARENPAWGAPLGGTADVPAGAIIHAARAEMAQHLDDAVMRRTDLGTRGDPGAAALEHAADLMAEELGWTPDRRAAELARTRALFTPQPAASREAGC